MWISKINTIKAGAARATIDLTYYWNVGMAKEYVEVIAEQQRQRMYYMSFIRHGCKNWLQD